MAARGRPSKEPSKADKKKVQQFLADELSIADIAALMNVSVPTFRKHFAGELFAAKKNKSAAQKNVAGAPAVPPLPFKVSKDHRTRVIKLIGYKMEPLDVARVLRITREQLEHHFAEEIAIAHADMRAKVLEKLDEELEAGKVPAMNRLESITAATSDSGRPAATPREGKKVAARAAAQVAGQGTEWGDDLDIDAPPPGSSVN